MQSMLMIFNDPERWTKMPKATNDAVMAEWTQFMNALVAYADALRLVRNDTERRFLESRAEFRGHIP